MQNLVINKINETIYYEKLENGLEVFLFPKNNTHNNYVTFTTKFGSINNEFIPYGKQKMIKVPNGIAHFLEHKLFAQEKGPDPAQFFENSGTDYNAHTSFKNTTYELTGPNNLIENICFLLDYVQSPYFTEENIDQERGIIKEEINMINDNPWNILYDKIRYNSFIKHPIKESIIGNHKDIDRIDKNLLYDCYNTFYHPSNMFLVVSGNFLENEVMAAIKENQSKKEFPEFIKIASKDISEPEEVFLENEVVEFNTDVPKMAYSIKIPIKQVDGIDKKSYLLYIHMLLFCLFDDGSLFDFECKKKGIITSSVQINSINLNDYIIVSLVSTTECYQELIDLIADRLKKHEINEEDFERKKKVLISNEIFMYDDILGINDSIVDNIIFDGNVELNIIGLINKMNIKDLKRVIKAINLSNRSIVVVKKKN